MPDGSRASALPDTRKNIDSPGSPSLTMTSPAARALSPVAAAGFASVVGYVAMLWTLAGLAGLAALLAVLADRRFRAEEPRPVG